MRTLREAGTLAAELDATRHGTALGVLTFGSGC